MKNWSLFHTKTDCVNVSDYSIKQELTDLFCMEIVSVNISANIFFFWSNSYKVGTLLFDSKKEAKVGFNLFRIRKCIRDYSNDEMLRLVVFLAVEYLDTINKANILKPDSYLEGLSFLDSITLQESRRIDFFIPFLSDCKIRYFRYSAIDIYCITNAISRVVQEHSSKANNKGSSFTELFGKELTFLSVFPEICYNKSEIPMYELICAVSSVQHIIKKQPSLALETPVLSELVHKDGTLISIKEMIEICGNENNPFYCGIAIRLIALIKSNITCAFEEKEIDYLASIAAKYRKECAHLTVLNSSVNSWLYLDSLFASRSIIKELDKIFGNHDIPSFSNVHPM